MADAVMIVSYFLLPGNKMHLKHSRGFVKPCLVQRRIIRPHLGPLKPTEQDQRERVLLLRDAIGTLLLH